MKKARSTPENAAGNRNGPDEASPKKMLSKQRTWMFRVLTLVLIPAVILGSLELALKVAGYGYPTSFFINSRIGDHDFLITNDKFGYRFFPPDITRKSAHYRISAEKPKDVYRVFVFGESAALGIPDWSYGASRYLDVLLEERYPDTDFEVICVAVTAINSHAILPIAREAARLDGDLWVVYMGNNEMVGPFGAGTIFGAKAPGLGFVRTSLALKTTRLGQLMESLISRLGPKSDMPTRWTGINMFKKNLLRHNDPKRLRAYRNFEGNLKDILKAGRNAGVPIILSTVGSNLKDCSPFASMHREHLDTALKSEWDLLFQEGLSLEETGQFEEALSRYSDAAGIDAEYAELQFRMGTCLLALGHAEQAWQAFSLARDHDALAVRADTRINRILMDAVPENDSQISLVDAEKALSAQSSNRIPGQELFYEHVHFTVEGNFNLARVIADRVKTFLPPDILESQTDDWLDQEACNRQLALTVWDQARLWQEEAKRVNLLPFVAQTSNPLNKSYINKKRKNIKTLHGSGTWAEDHQLYVSALERAPEDTFLIENYSEFLDASGKKEEAIEQAEKYCELLPDFPWPHCWLAALLTDAGRLDEARESVESALNIDSNYTAAQALLKQIKQLQ